MVLRVSRAAFIPLVHELENRVHDHVPSRGLTLKMSFIKVRLSGAGEFSANEIQFDDGSGV